MPLGPKQHIGEIGETLACKYLRQRGYQILKRRFRCREGEVDIVARDRKHQILVFFEVKTRTQNAFGQPQEAVDFFKQRKLIRVAQRYLRQYSREQEFRIDVISIFLDFTRRAAQVRHFCNAIDDQD